jgi:hypothetical protein
VAVKQYSFSAAFAEGLPATDERLVSIEARITLNAAQ